MKSKTVACNIPITRPVLGEEEKIAVAKVIDSGWLTQGAVVHEFERLVAQYVGANYAVAVTSCTTALHLALMLHHVGAGDEVIVPSYTWVATANVVRMVGATPVFADIELETFNISPKTVEPLLSSKTKAILTVDQFGLPADLDGLNELAGSRGIVLIEDAACSLGSRYKGRPVGGHGFTACFSFHPRKLISTGEGGMLATNDQVFERRSRILLNHGVTVPDTVKHRAKTVEALLAEEVVEVGYNYRLTDLQAALGVVQMKRLEEILLKRRQKAERYQQAFSGSTGLIPPSVPNFAQPNWQTYALRVSQGGAAKRNQIAQRLLDEGIACRPGYMACHRQPAYRPKYPKPHLPNTETALESVLLLPLYPELSEGEQDFIIDTVLKTSKAGNTDL